ncbi:transcriptional regulator, TetR family protein [Verrucomicrobiia bacterium DG1235]|nr:transcriptional regulator, TetR family protein [Verrucomicrobiae bacterium DG1235]
MTEKSNKKALIVEVASKLFFEQGYHVTGIKQIIEAADIAKGTFYSHFKSKEELGLEWLRLGHDQWVVCRNKYLDEVGDDPEAQLIALFDYLAQGSKACNYRGCAFINTLAESPDLGCPMRKAIQDYKRGFLAFIRSLVDKRLPNANDEEREQRAGAIYLLFEGATVASQSFCKTGPIDIAKRQVSAILSH